MPQWHARRVRDGVGKMAETLTELRVDTVTVRCEGTIADVRLLRRHLLAEGLTVVFGSHGTITYGATSYRPEQRRWFQLVVSGTGSADVCARIVAGWSAGGNVAIV